MTTSIVPIHDSPAEPPVDMVTVTVDGIGVAVPKNTLIIRAAEMVGIQVPRFCDHPLLEPVGACRQCLVEVGGQRKPLASCTTTVADGMEIHTQLSSEVARKAQEGVMELLLINHPLDCPVCDKGGECPLQNQAMSNGRGESRFHDVKRTYPKPVPISSQVLLDRERCVLCARCTRFSEQVAGDHFIELLERGALEQVGISDDEPFESYFSGNTVQICPVGALTGAQYRFRSRPFDLVSTPTACEHCASGCAVRTDHRRGSVLRRLAGEDPAVNEEWNCDKGRWAHRYPTAADRLELPMVRGLDGELTPVSWSEALAAAARGLASARAKGTGVLVGGRVTQEDAYAYSKFARMALDTNDIDFRSRPHSAEESGFLTARVAGRGLGVTYADLESAPTVLLVGFEPEEESPIVFLRLRKAARRGGLRVYGLAPYATRGLSKMQGQLLSVVPGGEAAAIDAMVTGEVGKALEAPGAVILVGERAGSAPGALSAAARLADRTGARLAWIPRRAGERGAVDAGALPDLLPGGRPVADPAARVDIATVWGVGSVPSLAGRDTAGILAAAAAGTLGALVVGGVEPEDLPNPAAALAALDAVDFLVSLELRASSVTERADVVLPVAAVTEKSGTFVDWEGRPRFFEAALDSPTMPDGRVLHALADELDVALGLPDVTAARAELADLGAWEGETFPAPEVPATAPMSPAAGEAVLATWRLLLDLGRLQDGEPYLAGTARAAHAVISPATAAEMGWAVGNRIAVSTGHGTIRLPVSIAADIPDRVVWLPTNSTDSRVRQELAVDSGAIVQIAVEQDAFEATNGAANKEGAAR
jgi:NADH-quinone oxidoreductase subunit G